jgi:hypothetical protein
MDQTPIITEMNFGEDQNPVTTSPNRVPGWQKCLPCMDYGSSCNGPSLNSLGDIASVRTFHKAMRRSRNIPLKKVADAAPSISEKTVNEYFSNTDRDYKWTTVMAIDNAMLTICGNRYGLPPLDHACPASSSEFRQQIAAAEMKVAAADLKTAQSESDMLQLQQKLTDTKGKHIAQIAQMEERYTKDIDWMKDEIRLWRRFAFLLLAIGIVLLTALVFFVGWNLAHPGVGLLT